MLVLDKFCTCGTKREPIYAPIITPTKNKSHHFYRKFGALQARLRTFR